MTLTYDLDLDILRFDLHAKNQVYISVLSAKRSRQRARDRHTHDVKTTTPSANVGYKNNIIIFKYRIPHTNKQLRFTQELNTKYYINVMESGKLINTSGAITQE